MKYNFIVFIFALIASAAAASAQQVTVKAEAAGFSLILNETDQDCSVQFKAGAAARAAVSSVTGPARIVVDISGTKSGVPSAAEARSSRFVSKIRFGLHQKKLRVVLDIIGDLPHFELSQVDGDWVLRMTREQVAPKAAPVETAKPARKPSILRDAEPRLKTRPSPAPQPSPTTQPSPTARPALTPQPSPPLPPPPTYTPRSSPTPAQTPMVVEEPLIDESSPGEERPGDKPQP